MLGEKFMVMVVMIRDDNFPSGKVKRYKITHNLFVFLVPTDFDDTAIVVEEFKYAIIHTSSPRKLSLCRTTVSQHQFLLSRLKGMALDTFFISSE